VKAQDIAYSVGNVIISVEDFARAIAVQDARGEEMNDPAARTLRMQEATDILDRAFRFAQQKPKR
jgi:hypothetical protein